MPIEARDRLVRSLHVATVFSQRRLGILEILSDESETSSPTNGSTQRGLISPGAARANGGSVVGAGRDGNSDSAQIFRKIISRFFEGHLQNKSPEAIERRRARLREVHGQETEILQLQDQRIPNSYIPLPGAHNNSPTTRVMGCPPAVGRVPKILLNVTNQAAGGSEFLTQKKLLNSIDTIQKQVMEELRKLKRTPAAKKAAR